MAWIDPAGMDLSDRELASIEERWTTHKPYVELSKLSFAMLISELKRRRATGRWIPTCERLPRATGGIFDAKPEDLVLVLLNGHVSTAYHVGENIWDHDNWHGAANQVTHWMPLPKLPADATARPSAAAGDAGEGER